MYSQPQGYGPTSVISYSQQQQRKKQMRATQVWRDYDLYIPMELNVLTVCRPVNNVDNENKNVTKERRVRFVKRTI